MILTSSFLTVLENHASGTARMTFRLAEIIKTLYDDHTKIAGFFMILKAVDGDDHINFWHDKRVPKLTSLKKFDNFGVIDQNLTYRGLPW